MQWSAGVNGGFSNAQPDALYTSPINDPVAGYTQVNVESQRQEPSSLLHTIQRMVHTRKSHSVFALGELIWLVDLPKEALCFWRTNGQEQVLVLHNLSDQPLMVPLPADKGFTDLLNTEASIGGNAVQLAPFGYRWLVYITD
jgi:maltose alpha-D-glucosyltransferase/alpha-amylase